MDHPVVEIGDSSPAALRMVEVIIMRVIPGKPIQHYINICREVHEYGRKQCVWVVFDGYEEDDREVWEIPACKEWAVKLLETIRDQKDGLGLLATIGDDRGDLALKNRGLGLVQLLAVAGFGTVHKDPHSDLYSFTMDTTARDIVEGLMELIERL